MSSNVIMPQLGMAQETGIIAKWVKQVGDAVSLGEVLMEVETDKTVMEVEATQGGYLVEIIHADGAEVPVGDTVAIIGEKASENTTKPAGKKLAAQSQPKDNPAEPPKARAKPASKPKKQPPVEVAASADKILASPKAKEYSRQIGASLQAMRAAGIREPFHHADVANFAASSATEDLLEAAVDPTAFNDFAAWITNQAKHQDISLKEILCAFALGAWKASGGGTGAVDYLEPKLEQDLVTLRSDGPLYTVRETDAAAVLQLHNLVGTLITEYRPGKTAGMPVLSLSGHGSTYCAKLRFNPTHLSLPQAVALLEGFAARLLDPRHHLI